VTKALNRRAFLASGVIATAAVAVAGASPAGAAGELSVYRLSADWGYPVGPKNKTRCSCKACFRRAENAYFRTRDAALAGRIHPCCVCQPYATTVPGVTGHDLFQGAQSVDRRDPKVAEVFQNITVPSAEPVGAVPGVAGLVGGIVGEPTSPDAEPTAATGFARTGSGLGLARVGAGVLGVGAALLAFRNRNPEPVPATASTHPTNKESS
jgi:hypothetical protein